MTVSEEAVVEPVVMIIEPVVVVGKIEVKLTVGSDVDVIELVSVLELRLPVVVMDEEIDAVGV